MATAICIYMKSNVAVKSHKRTKRKNGLRSDLQYVRFDSHTKNTFFFVFTFFFDLSLFSNTQIKLNRI